MRPMPITRQVSFCGARNALADALVRLCSAVGGLANELRLLTLSGINETVPHFDRAGGQTGSSAMPHKVNPIDFEHVVGLTRTVVPNAARMLHESGFSEFDRDLTQSVAERVAWPLISGMTVRAVVRLTIAVGGVAFNLGLVRSNLNQAMQNGSGAEASMMAHFASSLHEIDAEGAGLASREQLYLRERASAHGVGGMQADVDPFRHFAYWHASAGMFRCLLSPAAVLFADEAGLSAARVVGLPVATAVAQEMSAPTPAHELPAFGVSVAAGTVTARLGDVALTWRDNGCGAGKFAIDSLGRFLRCVPDTVEQLDSDMA
jgi:hypothetical protein